MELLTGFVYSLSWKLLYKAFQTIKFGSVYAGVVQAQGVCKSLVSVKTGVDNGH